ncbi:MDR family oxidoreductase [Anaerolineales bacterium HSG24]|nr:MDR family oxidoreductase [Anaerolineales bacterium HSG24]
MTNFKAMLLEKVDNDVIATIKELSLADLPDREVLVSVAYSSLNYKDGLAVTNSAPVVRKFPMVPGIDLVGMVEESASATYKAGDAVVLTGWEVGEAYWGGYAQKARLKADWLVPLPSGLTPKQAMQIGTAGFTAMMSVMALEEQGVTPDKGEVVVTGAAGGVGSVSVALLAKLGYTVVASTGRGDSLSDYLIALGASRIIGRFESSKRPLERELWAGAVDTVGNETLAAVLRQTARSGSVAACGLVGGGNLPTTVYPFILRGVNLLGIDSVMCPVERRIHAWQRLAELMSAEVFDLITEGTVTLEEISTLSEQILKGQVKGRVVVDLETTQETGKQ